jgi:HEXXH motif-containing protein
VRGGGRAWRQDSGSETSYAAPMDTGLLLLPPPGDPTLSGLLRRVRLLALGALLRAEGHGLAPGEQRSLSRIQGQLAEQTRTKVKGVLSAIGAPDVLPSLLCLHGGIGDPAALLRGLVPPLFAALGGTGRGLPEHLQCPPARATPPAVTEALLWEGPIRHVGHPRAGWAANFSQPGTHILVDPSGVEVQRRDGRRVALPGGPGAPVGHAYAFVHERLPLLHLCLQDTNPLSSLEAHPDKQGNSFDLGSRTVEHWAAALAAAIDLIELALPEWLADAAPVLERIVPVGFDAERHNSASYREAPGLLYLSLHPDPLTMAEAVVHEAQHGKLNLLSWLDPVLHDGLATQVPSPVRPDLRPLIGVLLAAHAFVPVQVMHDRLAAMAHPLSQTPRFNERRAQVRAANQEALATLRTHGRPSEIGARLLSGLEALAQAPG